MKLGVPALPTPEAPAPTSSTRTDQNYTETEVFFGTDRQAVPGKDWFGPDRGEVLVLGRATVSIPRDHKRGELESHKWWKLQFRDDPENHVALLNVAQLSRDDFLFAVRERVADSSAKDAFIFIHGYNVTFADALRRAGQMAYDLEFAGAPIVYSWPSHGELIPYVSDQANAEATASDLFRFLQLVAEESQAERLHVIAHSMGNRALGLALALGKLRSQCHKSFHEIILAAPDIDAQVFVDQVAPRLTSAGDKVTLYASSKDEALRASAKLNGHPRAGDISQGVVIVNGVDTVDASDAGSEILGHSYFADSTPVLSDIHSILSNDTPPSERHDLIKKLVPRGAYWAFQPRRR